MFIFPIMILKNISKNILIRINKNEVIGIIGGTASGKSTIINLLSTFYDVTKEK